MDKIPCTVGILTFNSGKTLRRALESVKDFDDIVLCDGGSTDDTHVIAEEFGARIIAQSSEFKNPDNTLRDYSGVRNQCVEAGRYDWFFYIDSDESAEPALVEEIRKVVMSDSSDLIYNISPRIVLDGKVIEHSSNYPGWQKRFFNRSTGARFRKTIHERIAYDVEQYPAGYLKGHWHYFIFTANAFGRKRARYTRMEAERLGVLTLGSVLLFVLRKMLTIGNVVVKSVLNRIRFGSQSMPLQIEWRRVRYQAELLWFVVEGYVKRSA